jgi:hypothetical protein
LPALTRFLVLLAFLPVVAQADLYRWVDPASGSVKFANSPPPWLEDGTRGPAVEVIPFRPNGTASGTPATGAAAPAAAPEPGLPIASLEAQWRGLLKSFAQLPDRPDFDRSGPALQQQLQSFDAVRTELDRRDPAGAARRQAEEAGLLEGIRKGMEAQLGGRMPGLR